MAQVKAGHDTITVGELDDQVLTILTGVVEPPHFPLHLAVQDAAGDSLVIEFLHGHVTVLGNPNGVMTNSPALAWHLTNLAVHQAAALPLPGDFSSASRFLRLSQFNTQASVP